MERSIYKKKVEQDLWIIIISMTVSFMLLIVLQRTLTDFIYNSDTNIILRTFAIAMFQFGVAGLGAVIIMLLRKERFVDYGLVQSNLLVTVTLSVLCFVPYIIYIVLSGQFEGYQPLSVMITPQVTASGFPTNIIGILIIGVVWGFFEGFNYVVISKKINELHPPKSVFLNWGAILCTIMCILIHGIIGVNPEQIIELICVIIIIYGMLLVRDKYNNSWGIIVIFVLFWNAF